MSAPILDTSAFATRPKAPKVAVLGASAPERCAYCHEPFEAARWIICGCGSCIHVRCGAEFGRCPTCGASEEATEANVKARIGAYAPEDVGERLKAIDDRIEAVRKTAVAKNDAQGAHVRFEQFEHSMNGYLAGLRRQLEASDERIRRAEKLGIVAAAVILWALMSPLLSPLMNDWLK